MKPNLKPVKGVPAADTEELTPTTNSLGAKGESESAPAHVCECGLRFAGDQGREFVKHTLTCSKGSPVCPPKAGRHSHYYTCTTGRSLTKFTMDTASSDTTATGDREIQMLKPRCAVVAPAKITQRRVTGTHVYALLSGYSACAVYKTLLSIAMQCTYIM